MTDFIEALTRQLHTWQDETVWLDYETVRQMLVAAAAEAAGQPAQLRLRLADGQTIIVTERTKRMKLDLGLNNAQLYDGCQISETAGRLTLDTPPDVAANAIGRNALKLVESTENRDEVTLTGPMAVWAYLVVFHVVVHRFSEVWYDDGRGNRVLIARH